jgi:yeast amino acid transporter
VPYYAVALTAVISALTYLSCGEGADTAFVWFQNIAALSGLFTWCSVLIAYLRFYAALKAQNIDRDTLQFKSPGQPYLAIGSLVFFTLVTFFNGFYTVCCLYSLFRPCLPILTSLSLFKFMPWDASDFVTAYIGIPIFFALFLGYKLFKRTKLITYEDIDLHTGKDVLDAMEDSWPMYRSKNWISRLKDVLL